ncbi:type II secretion system F family protein [Microbacterium indicum]|uniref:type II secretion system F family protein n=1 Tax=Microbacterium indicum TaxID=358100 RepID=UPI00041D3C5F|nr:type II secretion system F family protein [Microbacterium indicum]
MTVAITDVALAVLLGGALGCGAWLALAALPSWRAPALVDRVGPYVRDVTDPAGRSLPVRVVDPTAVLARGAGGVWRRAQRRFALRLGTSASIERRLQQAGRGGDVAAFRGDQLAWGLVGAAFGAVLLGAVIVAGRFQPPSVVLPVVGAVAGAIGSDMMLSSQAKARVARIGEELPTVLEFLSLCLAAGEGVLGSVRRVAQVGSGELTAELRAVTVEVDTGATLTDALGAMARRLDAPVLTRAVDHVVAAIDRGSPLAQTLQAQAADAREQAQRTLIEQAGRKEIFMMIPLVFGLLPLSVLFAIFPGIAMLRLGF